MGVEGAAAVARRHLLDDDEIANNSQNRTLQILILGDECPVNIMKQNYGEINFMMKSVGYFCN